MGAIDFLGTIVHLYSHVHPMLLYVGETRNLMLIESIMSCVKRIVFSHI